MYMIIQIVQYRMHIYTRHSNDFAICWDCMYTVHAHASLPEQAMGWLPLRFGTGSRTIVYYIFMYTKQLLWCSLVPSHPDLYWKRSGWLGTRLATYMYDTHLCVHTYRWCASVLGSTHLTVVVCWFSAQGSHCRLATSAAATSRHSGSLDWRETASGRSWTDQSDASSVVATEIGRLKSWLSTL